jgi:hypothetical protein
MKSRHSRNVVLVSFLLTDFGSFTAFPGPKQNKVLVLVSFLRLSRPSCHRNLYFIAALGRRSAGIRYTVFSQSEATSQFRGLQFSPNWYRIFSLQVWSLLITPTNGLSNLICAASIRPSSSPPSVQHSLPQTSASLLTTIQILISICLYFCGVGWDWIHLLRRPLIGLLYPPPMIDEYGTFGEMRIGRGNRNTRRKPVPVPLCPLQIPHDLTWERAWVPPRWEGGDW